MGPLSPPARTDGVVDQGCCADRGAVPWRWATDTPPTRLPRTRSGAALPRNAVVRNGSAIGQPDDHLAGVATAQEVEERRHGLLQPLAHRLADDEIARAHPAGDGIGELPPQIAVVADQEALDA